jgi:hypothetical protein
MRRSTLVLAVGMLAAALALATGGGNANASSTAAETACADFAGPAWSVPEFGKKGNQWKVLARGVPCQFATTWSKKLLHTPYKGEAATKLHGPAGWSCTPSIPHGGGVPGECRKGSKLFAWGPDAKL